MVPPFSRAERALVLAGTTLSFAVSPSPVTAFMLATALLILSPRTGYFVVDVANALHVRWRDAGTVDDDPSKRQQ
jgi:hypothetical protein